MKKSLSPTIVIIGLLIVGNLPFIAQGSPGNMAPPPPITPTLTSTPLPISGMSQGNPTPPTPGEFQAQVEQTRARQAMEAALAKYLRYWGPRYQAASIEVAVEGEWAHGVAKWQSQTRTLRGPIHILAHRLPDGTWQALMPVTDGAYLQWLEAVPEHLMPADEKSQLRAQAAEADALLRPQAAPAVPQAEIRMAPGKEGPGEPVEPVSGLAQPTATPTPISEPVWGTYVTVEFGYSVRYPSALQSQERNSQDIPNQGGVPSDVWFGERIHIITRIPPLPDDALLTVWKDAVRVKLPQGLQALRLERVSEPIGGGTPLTSIEYLVRANGVDFFLVYNPLATTPADDQERQIFEAMVTTFTILPKRTYTPPVIILAAQTDGFDFPVDPRDGSSGRPPWYASYNVRNPYVSGWSNCYSKPLSQLQHAGEDWFRSAGSNVYAVANGRVIWSDKNANYPGGVIIIEHTLPSGVSNPWGGNLIYSMYGHLDPNSMISQWADVTRGQVIGKIYNWGSNSHVHFEMRRYGNMQQAPEWVNGYHFCNTSWPGPGYTDTGANPDWFGYTHPSNWVDNHRPGSNPNTPPRTPSLVSPSDWYVSNDGTAPQLCWQNNGDPDGDTVQFYAEVYQSAVNANSGWTNNTCWRPSSLDGKYYNYQWHVKAKDSRGAESGWSDTWHFTINPPQCSYNANQIALYANTGYGGSCVTLGVGDYPNPGYLGSLGNDNAESIRVGSNVQAILYEHDNYQGRSETFTGDDSNLGDNYIGANSVSSVRVQWRAQPPAAPTLRSPSNGATFNEGQGINLSWSATGNEYYGEIWGGPGGTLTFGWQSGTSKNIGSQWAGYTYSWHVKARNGAGQSGWSSTWTFTVRPAAPSNLSAQATSCNQVTLYWTDNSGNEEGYKIYRNGAYIGQVGMNATSYQDAGLSENTTYSYYVRAFRGSIESGTSNTVNVTTPFCCTKPDLTPSQWGGWQYPVVPSSITGTVVVNTLYAGRPTYIDWGLTNAGHANTGGNTYGALYIDATRVGYYDFGNVLAGQTWAFFDWMETINVPGWHTLKSISDPDNLIDECDESNNTFEHQFYWIPSAPYYDDMESGTNGWTATGLWHQVDFIGPDGWRRWWYGQDSTNNYDTGAANSGDLTSPPVYIPSTGYYLRFL